MKKPMSCLIVALAFILSANTLSANDLLKYVPKDANVVVYLKIKDMLNLPVIKEIKSQNMNFAQQHGKLESKLKEKGLKIEDLAQDVAIFAIKGDDSGALFKTSVSEAKLKELLAGDAIDKNGVKFTE